MLINFPSVAIICLIILCLSFLFFLECALIKSIPLFQIAMGFLCIHCRVFINPLIIFIYNRITVLNSMLMSFIPGILQTERITKVDFSYIYYFIGNIYLILVNLLKMGTNIKIA